jgi:hypothetical protein
MIEAMRSFIGTNDLMESLTMMARAFPRLQAVWQHLSSL